MTQSEIEELDQLRYNEDRLKEALDTGGMHLTFCQTRKIFVLYYPKRSWFGKIQVVKVGKSIEQVLRDWV